jgi:hypothetical protein
MPQSLLRVWTNERSRQWISALGIRTVTITLLYFSTLTRWNAWPQIRYDWHILIRMQTTFKICLPTGHIACQNEPWELDISRQAMIDSSTTNGIGQFHSNVLNVSRSPLELKNKLILSDFVKFLFRRSKDSAAQFFLIRGSRIPQTYLNKKTAVKTWIVI